jgi:hypothetical protein
VDKKVNQLMCKCFYFMQSLPIPWPPVEGLPQASARQATPTQGQPQQHLTRCPVGQWAIHNEWVIWFLNSGATSHMMCNCNWLHDYWSLPINCVMLGNDAMIDAISTHSMPLLG